MKTFPPLKKRGAKPKAVRLPEASLKGRRLCLNHLATAKKMLAANRTPTQSRYPDAYLNGVIAALTWLVSENGTAEPPVRWSSEAFYAKKKQGEL